ncbi:hypothetical protein GGP41_002346 [Bipolaris sorokiniana]|uniref:Uncharacterized protein n=2 Tax=Cochliobolus sativus TaxID=45130 RepID=A0A8H5ZGY7_COCSA|nr:uncharacterized protein COCSADRAFT_94974 [Bipolaris sorokiniana ND90Pr]EMD62198.1 hypothetical protein COCSADRAFT_94974 [Bipolaris sorokiniana ND90Pr]KAF5850076.1 hypothetical protein GGP41_002346 [Bipolaris sorokiniana]
MHFSNTLHSFLLLFSFATALPTDMSSITQSASIANNHLTLETRDGFCSPKCKQQFDDLQSWRWISYSMLINEYNIKVRLYVENWTQPLRPGNPPNAAVEKLHWILEKLHSMTRVKPKPKAGGE